MSKINNFNASVAFADTKPHYILLDGLRGVAALMVLWYHVFEGFAFAKGSVIETFNTDISVSISSSYCQVS